ncbi:hypothetical protein, partial [Acinetobacter baumannii]|uniref:hypothetical protein n=1 Tax=Acinetobacter baumannii TaxID=470 RepID=UPI001C082A50
MQLSGAALKASEALRTEAGIEPDPVPTVAAKAPQIIALDGKGGIGPKVQTVIESLRSRSERKILILNK